jgi:hypothetical protein
MKKLLPLIILILYGLHGTAQIKPDTVITATDTLISFYSVKPRFDTLVTVSYDTTKTVVVKKVIQQPAYTRQNLIMDFTVEQPDALTKTGAKLYYYWNGFDKASNALAYAFTRVNNFSRSGYWSMRVELRRTDNDVAGSKRAEARRASNDEPTLKERWYGASYYLPTDYIADPAPESLTQWQSLKAISPPLALWTENGRWKVVQNGNISTDIGEYKKEKWTDFVFHVKWSLNNDGLIEVWKDGVKVFTKLGPNSYPDYITGNYMKSGIYKWRWKSAPSTSNTTKRVVYIDDVRIGNEYSTYKDVVP